MNEGIIDNKEFLKRFQQSLLRVYYFNKGQVVSINTLHTCKGVVVIFDCLGKEKH